MEEKTKNLIALFAKYDDCAINVIYYDDAVEIELDLSTQKKPWEVGQIIEKESQDWQDENIIGKHLFKVGVVHSRGYQLIQEETIAPSDEEAIFQLQRLVKKRNKKREEELAEYEKNVKDERKRRSKIIEDFRREAEGEEEYCLKNSDLKCYAPSFQRACRDLRRKFFDMSPDLREKFKEENDYIRSRLKFSDWLDQHVFKS